jgi:hypothetical protein
LTLTLPHRRHTTVTNVAAYRALALDFELWSRTKKEIQRVYLDHFSTVVEVSKYNKFNTRQRLSRMGLVRKLIFVLQTGWFDRDMIGDLMTTLRIVVRANWSKDEGIKPIVTFLAGNLHDGWLPLFFRFF